MKRITGSLLGLILASSLLVPQIHAETNLPGMVDFGKFTPAKGGKEFVEVRINGAIISMAARLAEKAEPEVATTLRSLKFLRVNVIGLTDENRAGVQQQIETLRGSLDGNGWERVVMVQQDKEDVGVWLKTAGEQSVQGLVVTVINDQKEAVLVNVVGDIRPEQLASLGEKFGIDPLKEISKNIKK